MNSTALQDSNNCSLPENGPQTAVTIRCVGVGLLTALFVATAASVRADERLSFSRDIRPILADKCFHCHGPDATERQADLRLDVESSAMADRDGQPAIVPGRPDSSELVHRILADDADFQMPPPDSGRELSHKDKQALIRWIREGAHWEAHWSFVPPERPVLPDVHESDWPRNEIDRFVLGRMQEQGLQPSPETDRSAWIRRVTFDLTGLPPTLAEIDAFLADGSPAAFEKVVDRLLHSTRYGEHMAAMWLDAARYADTDGYQNDGPRTMFRWRDWVIEAYNRNMPFDQFTIEQLAGDLLPNATLEQKIATGFNRNHRYNSEAGLVPEEFLLENAVDRVDTTSTIWMGLTMGCARCHDHKYDPFSQREYYQLVSFFDNITECGRAIKFGNSEPWIIAPTASQQQQLEKLDADIRRTKQQLANREAKFDEALHQIPDLLKAADVTGSPQNDVSIVSRGRVHYLRFEDLSADGMKVESGTPVLRAGFSGKSATTGGSDILQLGKICDVACQTRSSISFWLKPEVLQSGVILSRQSAGTTRPGFTVEIRDGRLQFYIITRWVAGVGAVETTARLPADQWTHVVLTNDGSQRAKGQQIWLNGALAETTILHNTNSNTGGTKTSAILRLGGGVVGDRFKGQLDELGFYKRTLFKDEISILAEPTSVADILATPRGSRTARMTVKLRHWFATAQLESVGRRGAPRKKDPLPHAISAYANLFGRLQTLREQRVRLLDSFPTTMVMEERALPRDTPVRIRGEYHNHGAIVSSDTPSVFPPLPDGPEPARLRFARWLVSGNHPLTARVAVNRYWQQYFGQGLVNTPEDFGMQGAVPSHPKLLDWLAVEFVESGWDVKALQKRIVLSATFRQSSRVQRTKAGESVIDPLNRFLSRGPRLRLTARQLRDQALYVAGLMTPDIGGPSVSPYQPAGLWAEMSNMQYRQAKGKDLYRRGLYTIWKRTVAPPSLAILDAADRESCSVRPKRTNTPLQALTLLNETTFVEAARHLANRMQSEAGEDAVEFAFRTVTGRSPTASELSALNESRAEFQAEFEADEDAAGKLLSVGESPIPESRSLPRLAADTLLCNLILNLDEALTKR